MRACVGKRSSGVKSNITVIAYQQNKINHALKTPYNIANIQNKIILSVFLLLLIQLGVRLCVVTAI